MVYKPPSLEQSGSADWCRLLMSDAMILQTRGVEGVVMGESQTWEMGCRAVCDGVQGSLGWDMGQFVIRCGAVWHGMQGSLLTRLLPSSSGPIHLRSPVLGKNLS